MSGMQGENADLDSQQPTLCEAGCGFFANAACNGMCSKCYRDANFAKERSEAASSKLIETIIAPSLAEPSGQTPTDASSQDTVVRSVEALPEHIAGPTKEILQSEAREREGRLAETSSANAEAQPVEIQDIQTPKRPQDPKRCYFEGCGKKINPILSEALRCKCGFKFCNAHRLPGDHDCPVDHKEKGRKEIAKNNPLVQADRLNRMI